MPRVAHNKQSPETYRPNAEEAKRKFIDYIASGDSNQTAAAKVGRTVKGIEYWRKQDAEFAQQVDFVRARRQGALEKKRVPDFPEFCREYLGFELNWHQLQWFDILEGREPRDIHPSQTYVPGRPNRILINTPPMHAKSTTITQAYVTWCIVKNPNEHIVIVSQTKKLAKDFLYAIQQYLTHPTYRKLQQDFGPTEGWEKNSATWTKDAITFVPDRSEGAKDPTVQAIGLGSQIYGARATRIILDDVITLKNSKDHEAQIRWLAQEVLNRPGVKTGYVICVGTRVDAIDFYSELLDRFPGVYTYFASPAVLEFADDPEDWVVLWPNNENTSALALSMIRAETPPTSWARAYQQQTISDDAIFPAEAVMACVNKGRTKGLLSERFREGGMKGLTVIAGLDPATVGFTAAVVMAVDRKTQKRWVLDAYNHKDTTPAQMRTLIKQFTEKYGISEWRIERNAFQRFLTQDEDLRLWLHSRGCLLREHYTTGGNKWDPDFGVESMETLFADALGGNGLIDFPNPNFPGCGVIGELLDQFITWTPKTGGKTDLVMATWFPEIKAREICRPPGVARNHKKNSFMTRRGARQQVVIDIEALAHEQFYMDQEAINE